MDKPKPIKVPKNDYTEGNDHLKHKSPEHKDLDAHVNDKFKGFKIHHK